MLNIACIVFFFSGMSALLFEAAWFHLAGLVFGNSIAATAVVLSSFMGGLALGNFWAARWGDKVRRSALVYAGLELVIGVSGFALVLLLPALTALMTPLFRPLLGQPVLLGALRGICAFLLLLIPTTAMGATLPVLISLFDGSQERFGRSLGMLYGWNTFGATVGVLLGEIVLMPALGIRLSGAVAALCNVTAAGAAWFVLRHLRRPCRPAVEPALARKKTGFSKQSVAVLAAAAGAGFVLLALEIVWFRFLMLFFNAFSLNFALMLAVVLVGISAGGLIASRIHPKNIFSDPVTCVALNATLLVFSYTHLRGFSRVFQQQSEVFRLIVCALFLMLPVSIVSGMVYTLLGRELYRRMPSESRASGWLTVANTLGGMVGSLTASLLLLPLLGMELSFFLLALCYASVSALLWLAFPLPDGKSFTRIAMAGATVVALTLFPYNRMQEVYAKIPFRTWEKAGEIQLAWHEGTSETIQYLFRPLLGKAWYYRLVTNAHSMSSTKKSAQRYMRLYVYLPMALNPSAQNALLICFGCGNTARALTETKTLRHIDVVDISPDVIKTSDIIYGEQGENPLSDPRLQLHIEDGRFFLLTTDKTYDLITAEPPPLRYSKVANLYSEEYFRLLYRRLSAGGIMTYWLPVYQIEEKAAKAIVRAFLNVFENATLWTGAGDEWMLVGFKPPLPQPRAEEFKRQWDDPVVSRHLRAIGLPVPEILPSLFIADRERLRQWTGDVPPLRDDFPHRISSRTVNRKRVIRAYRTFSRPQVCRADFAQSALMQRVIPPEYRALAEPYFDVQPTVTAILNNEDHPLSNLHRCIREPLLQPYILWALRSDLYAQEIVDAARQELGDAILTRPDYCHHMAARAIANGEYQRAEDFIDRILLSFPASRNRYFQLKNYLIFLRRDPEGLLQSFRKFYDGEAQKAD